MCNGESKTSNIFVLQTEATIARTHQLGCNEQHRKKWKKKCSYKNAIHYITFTLSTRCMQSTRRCHAPRLEFVSFLLSSSLFSASCTLQFPASELYFTYGYNGFARRARTHGERYVLFVLRKAHYIQSLRSANLPSRRWADGERREWRLFEFIYDFCHSNVSMNRCYSCPEFVAVRLWDRHMCIMATGTRQKMPPPLRLDIVHLFPTVRLCLSTPWQIKYIKIDWRVFQFMESLFAVNVRLVRRPENRLQFIRQIEISPISSDWSSFKCIFLPFVRLLLFVVIAVKRSFECFQFICSLFTVVLRQTNKYVGLNRISEKNETILAILASRRDSDAQLERQSVHSVGTNDAFYDFWIRLFFRPNNYIKNLSLPFGMRSFAHGFAADSHPHRRASSIAISFAALERNLIKAQSQPSRQAHDSPTLHDCYCTFAFAKRRRRRRRRWRHSA